jgi:polar amino acid transport system permease protein
MSVFDIIINYREGFLKGLLVTLQLCLLIWSSGLVIGSVIGVAGAKWGFTVGLPSRVASFTLSGIPVLVFLFWLHYPLQAMLNVVINPFYTAAATLSIINIFAVSDQVRSIINNFPSQFVTAGRVCGLTSMQILFRIQFPIILRQILPSLLITQINMLQATLFASLISVDEIFRVAQRVNAIVYRPVEIYTVLGLFFLAVCLPLKGIAMWLEKRFTRDLSER